MENILKLTVKRDVYDNLASGKQNYVYVEGNGYWIRRLATNSVDSFDKLKETQDFRTFDTVSVTCVKDNAVYPFKSIRTGNRYEGDNDAEDDGFEIWVEMNEYHNVGEETESENVNEPINEPNEDERYEGVDEVGEETNEGDDGDNMINDITTDLSEVELDGDDEQPQMLHNPYNIEKTIDDIIYIIGGYDNVVLVNTPAVIITSNGRIFGSKNRINLNNDQEIRFGIGTEKIIYDTDSDSDFISKVEKYLCDLAKNNYLFIWKDGCKLIRDNNEIMYLKLRMSIKRFR